MAQQEKNLAVRDRLIGVSDAIGEIRRLSRRVAGTKISVLLTGESGTGKDVVAQIIHDLSPRRDAPFVPVNCGAIPETLFESEMFGHEKGSFTGAERQRKGYFEQADGGTLFLDEIGEMPHEMQAKMLRALETGIYFRVGGSKAVNTDVRLLAATNRDLRIAVENGDFREDLYYRIRAVEIHLPPLRDRPDDIPPLVDRFANEFFLENKIDRQRILPAAMRIIENHDWEGNVRELKHFIGTLLTLEYDGPIDVEAVQRHLPEPAYSPRNLPVLATPERGSLDTDLILRQLLDLRQDVNQIRDMLAQLLLLGRIPGQLPESVAYHSVDEGDLKRPTLDEIECDQIRAALEEYGGNRRKAAKALGIGERTLYRKIKEYDL
ncbi:MAG TPA: sigma-54-dependent Fis family transcriptional regulator [Bacteroidetes bacterium]|nr:nitrogen assimilation regulatory protein [bacterium BMS3Bbin04]HDO64591.1 sigma-54-dependent Fis family transcriptional regulator [Bacteroidota bacterium]HEX03716.1 sigma-54-dependent Fis family transcriptional regulator [Bacteroidota bacterium]